MFNRKAYKQIAQKQLKGRWTTPVLAVLAFFAVYFLFTIPGTIAQLIKTGFDLQNLKDLIQSSTEFYNAPGSNGFSFHMQSQGLPHTARSSNLILTVVSYFICGAFIMAFSKLHVKMFHTTEKVPFNTFLEGFTQCISGFLGMLWCALWVFLWSLLFFIPGIVKAFAYSQMFFVMADNPKINCVQAMKISKAMTKGNKGDLFVMCLSFLGWDILALLTGGILNLWLIPYKNMSFTNAYYAMKAQALKLGILTPEDFGEPNPNSLEGEN